jgi:hypothetical protein
MSEQTRTRVEQHQYTCTHCGRVYVLTHEAAEPFTCHQKACGWGLCRYQRLPDIDIAH